MIGRSGVMTEIFLKMTSAAVQGKIDIHEIVFDVSEGRACAGLSEGKEARLAIEKRPSTTG